MLFSGLVNLYVLNQCIITDVSNTRVCSVSLCTHTAHTEFDFSLAVIYRSFSHLFCHIFTVISEKRKKKSPFLIFSSSKAFKKGQRQNMGI